MSLEIIISAEKSIVGIPVLLVITLLLIFTIISYRRVKHNSKQKGINELTI